MATLTIDTTGFREMARGLSRISGTPIKAVLLAETARVLEKCIENTPKGNDKAIARQIKFRNRSIFDNGYPRDPKKRGKQIGYITKGGTQWFADEPRAGYAGVARGRKMGSKTFHDMNSVFHWNNDRWGRWQGIIDTLKGRQIDLTKVMKSIGLSKNSWFQIARGLGIENLVKCSNYVRAAVPSNGRTYANGTGRYFATPDQMFVEIANDNPNVVRRMGGASILSKAIRGRISYFKKNMELAVFDDLKSRARAYRGIFVS